VGLFDNKNFVMKPGVATDLITTLLALLVRFRAALNILQYCFYRAAGQRAAAGVMGAAMLARAEPLAGYGTALLLLFSCYGVIPAC
jgi:hypothetical protein